MRVMSRVASLHIYPVKGCRGVSLTEVRLDARGPVGDRRFMIVDERGLFVTQRDVPKLALITAELSDATLTLHAPGAEALVLDATEKGAERKQVQVWRSQVDALSLGAEASEWLSRAIGLSVSLVQMDARALRYASETHAAPGTQVSFADGYPILLLSEASLAQLNDRLADQGVDPVPMNRFRPNLVVSGVEPHAEDTWTSFRIGEVTFDVVKPCDRCQVTTIDQATAIAGKEPLRTLSTYRKRDNRIFFGQNVIHRSEGTIRVGDAVELLSAR